MNMMSEINLRRSRVVRMAHNVVHTVPSSIPHGQKCYILFCFSFCLLFLVVFKVADHEYDARKKIKCILVVLRHIFFENFNFYQIWTYSTSF